MSLYYIAALDLNGNGSEPIPPLFGVVAFVRC